MHEYLQAIRAFSPSLRRFLISSALTTTVAFGLAAVLQNLYLLRLGFDARFIGLVLGIGQIVWATTALPAGLFSSRIGLRRGYQMGSGFFALGLALILLVETQPVSLWRAWLIGSQMVMMLGAAFLTVNIAPYLMTVTHEQERRHAFAVFQAFGPATAFLGSLVAGFLPGLIAAQTNLTLDQPAPYRLALWLGPILCMLAILPLFGADPARIAPESERQSASQPAPLQLLIVYGAIIFFQAIGEGAARTFFNIYLDTGLGVPPAQIGTIMGLAQLLPIVAALSIPILLARWGTGYTLMAAILGVSACLIPLAVGQQVWMAATAYMGVIAMSTLMGTGRDLLGQQLVALRWRTTIQSVVIIGLALGWAAIGVVGGWLIETVGFSAMFLAGSVGALLSAALLFTFLRAQHDSQAAKPEHTVI
jgi:MFS family permease